ncbi:DeoD-type purine-nucleoside phosphorylase [Herbiconiux moechotypicola]|uniref:Uridine phosphorylase n=1 Tax=Herbiconiux moechotypicola TaxID=637393 RepID=A0ABN3DF22_9MICO|nr:DeoD-type purine-nucleoside phosphorylase [Herbiconiux moechotypicola]MCS5729288.1 DeoD-type purine-nucleoside phosphorylase [Herbiconiux moechotypicola]
MPTAHISAEPGDFAPDVLLPGDPRRAQLIAETYLTGARLVTDVRGILGYTGTVDGRPLSVIASGMGIPSLSIYVTELVREYGVRRVVRVGTVGGIPAEVAVGDVVIASSAHTDSGLRSLEEHGIALSHAPSPQLLARAMSAASVVDGQVHVGPVFSTDFFYSPRTGFIEYLRGLGTLAVEMEAAGLYAIGLRERVQTLTIGTVADHTLGGPSMSATERERAVGTMVELALATLA